MREGIALYKKGLYKDALKSLLSTDLADEDHGEFSYLLGLCYARLKQYEEALLYLEQVVTGEGDFAHLYQSRMLLGWIYSETQRLRLATFEFRRLLDDGFASAKIYAALGHVLFMDEHVDESVDCLERALKMEPENPNALNSMGFILADRGQRLNLAFLYCSKAVKRFPNNPNYLDSLGWTLFKMGRHKDASGVLRRALSLAPGNGSITEHLKKVMVQHAK